jgi:hypothetical protein
MKTIKIYYQNWDKASDEGYIWISLYVDRKKINFSTKVGCIEKIGIILNKSQLFLGAGGKSSKSVKL